MHAKPEHKPKISEAAKLSVLHLESPGDCMKRPHHPLRIALGLLSAFMMFLILVLIAQDGQLRVVAAPAENVPRFEPARCPIPTPLGVKCGYLVVPEDRTQPDSQTIRLAVAILKSRSDAPAPDPVVHLTGGPGISTLEGVKGWRDHPFRETRDIILVEQRGTEHSEPWLACPEVDDALVENTGLALRAEEEIALEVEAAAECRDRLLAEGINLAAYNSAASAADLEDLRCVLGYDRWNLFGVSYGTRLILTIMRDYPEGIRSAILNSPFPPAADTYIELVPNTEQAFHALFADCEADPQCRATYPNLENTFYHGLEQVNAYPIPVSIRIPPDEVQLTAKDLIAGMFQSLRSTETNALLPFVISRAYEGDPDVLVPMVESSVPTFSAFSRGMLHSVECYEEAPFNPPEAIQEAAQVRPILLDYLPIHFNLAICDVWPSGQAGTIETEPVHSDIPTLLMAGEYDPYTPPSWAELAAETLSNSYVYVFPGIGHGPINHSECAKSITQAFLDDPTTEPDASCLAEVQAPDFVVPEDMYLTPAVYRLNVDIYVAPNVLRLALLGLCLLLFAVELVSFVIHVIRTVRKRVEQSDLLTWLARGLAAAVAALNLAFFAALVWVILDVSSTNWLMLAFGVPVANGWLFWLPRLSALLTLGLPVFALLAWRKQLWTQKRRVFYTVFTLASLLFVLLLLYWRMLALP
jgi:pimeloyl-ACP methyl ester carboxylesterase